MHSTDLHINSGMVYKHQHHVGRKASWDVPALLKIHKRCSTVQGCITSESCGSEDNVSLLLRPFK